MLNIEKARYVELKRNALQKYSSYVLLDDDQKEEYLKNASYGLLPEEEDIFRNTFLIPDKKCVLNLLNAEVLKYFKKCSVTTGIPLKNYLLKYEEYQIFNTKQLFSEGVLEYPSDLNPISLSSYKTIKEEAISKSQKFFKLSLDDMILFLDSFEIDKEMVSVDVSDISDLYDEFMYDKSFYLVKKKLFGKNIIANSTENLIFLSTLFMPDDQSLFMSCSTFFENLDFVGSVYDIPLEFIEYKLHEYSSQNTFEKICEDSNFKRPVLSSYSLSLRAKEFKSKMRNEEDQIKIAKINSYLARIFDSSYKKETNIGEKMK